MMSSFRWMLVWAGLLLGVGRAVDFTYTKSFNLGPGETAFSLQLDLFDASAHAPAVNLTNVTVAIEATFGSGLTFYEESGVGGNINWSLASARVLPTPVGTGLLTPAGFSLSLSGVQTVVASDDSSINSQASGSSSASSDAQATLDRYTVGKVGADPVVYDVDFTALYPQLVTTSPTTTTCIICNDRLTGQIKVTYSASAPPATEVVLTAFGASWGGPGRVILNWRTGLESNVLGFHLEREQGGEWQRVNSGLIAAVGDATGHSYRFEEAEVPIGEAVKYRLIEVNRAGNLIPLSEMIVQAGVAAGIDVTEAGVAIAVQGVPGQFMVLEQTADVARGPWVWAGGVRLDSGGAGSVAISLPVGEGSRFYRLRQD